MIKLINQYRGLSRSAYVLFIARMITNMGAFIWPMLTLILSEKLGYSTDLIALLSALVMISYIPAQLIGGRIADRFDNKKAIIILDLMSVALFISCGFVGINNVMVGLFVAAGFFATMEMPIFEAIVAKATKPKERERVMSLNYFGMNLGLVFGAMIGGFLFKNHLSLAFIIDGTTTFISTVLVFLFVKLVNLDEIDEEDKNEYETSRGDMSVLTYFKENQTIVWYMMSLVLGALIYNQWSYVLPLHLSELYKNTSGILLGSLTSVNAIVVVVFTPIITYLFNKKFELEKIAVGNLMIGLSYLLFLVSTKKAIFFAMIVFFTIGEVTNSIGSAPFISKRVPDSHRGRIGSIVGLSYFAGMILGRLIVGLLLSRIGFSMVYILIALVTIINSAIIARAKRLDQLSYPRLYDK